MSRVEPAAAVRHLQPAAWERANRELVAKALGEFAHERLVEPEPLPGGRYRVFADDGRSGWEFAATRFALDHWQVDPGSLVAHRGPGAPVDVVDLCLGLREALGLGDAVLPVYLEELTSTLAAAALRLDRREPTAAELAAADHQRVEAALGAGHPCFVANSGRIGFGGDDRLVHPPEAATGLRLVWLAARAEHAEFTAGDGVTYRELLAAELTPAELDRFAAALAGRGGSLATHLLIPVHPWQWWNVISVVFAGELATGRLTCLGEGDQEYLPQQSVRTLANRTAGHRHYVKTALSVLNMGFVRGLSAAYLAGAPAINDWVAELVAGDPVLVDCGFTVLRERAAVAYRHRQFEAATAPGAGHRKMLAALWRESPAAQLPPGRRAASMAALLHRDAAGSSVVGALVAESGLPAREWLRRYLRAYLRPLLHCFHAHRLAFMPHGENVILVLDGGVVERVIVKDLGEEVVVMDADAPLPAAVARIRARVPEPLQLLAIQTDVLDGFLRFLAPILVTDGLLGEDEFWAEVARCALDHGADVPELAASSARHDLFAPRFARSCLNRLQLRDNRQLVDLADPAGSLVLAGELDNPLAAHRPAAVATGASFSA